MSQQLLTITGGFSGITAVAARSDLQIPILAKGINRQLWAMHFEVKNEFLFLHRDDGGRRYISSSSSSKPGFYPEKIICPGIPLNTEGWS